MDKHGQMTSCGMAKRICSIADMEIGHKCEMSLSVYPSSDSQSAECTHSLSSEGRHSLVKLAVLIGSVAAACAIISAVCSAICGCLSGH